MIERQDSETAIRLTNVSCMPGRGSGTPILRELSLHVRCGEWVSVVGRNGSGKSTLMRLMAGLIPAVSGTIEIGGLTLSPDTLWQARESIGLVFPNPDNQFVGMTVEDDIAFGLENRQLGRPEMRERVHTYARLMDVHELLDRHPAQMSGGQKQRAALAGALALQPSILLLDEVSSMLDELSKQALLKLLHRLRSESDRGLTIIAVTHDADEMAASDRLIALHEGTVYADGRPDELLMRQDLLDACRIEPPYAMQLREALRRRGIEIGECLTLEEARNAIWAYNSKASTIGMKTAEPR